MPHYGLAVLVSSLRAAGFSEVSVVDAQAENLSPEEFTARIRTAAPRMVGFTAFTVHIEDAHSAAQNVKAMDPSIITVIGGVHASALPRQTLEEFSAFDLVIFGEGRVTLIETVRAIKDSSPLDEIAGLGWRQGATAVMNQARPLEKALDLLPLPAFDAMPLPKYRGYLAGFRRGLELPVFSSMGCPYSCAFCYRGAGQTVRYFSIPRILDEIERDISRFGATQIYFCDETFTLDRARAKDFTQAMIQRGLPRRISWKCSTRPELVDKELLALFQRANCRLIGYGVETGSQGVADALGKGLDLRRARQAVRLTRQAGIRSEANFILGLPGETQESLRGTIRFARSLNPDFLNLSLLSPLPGTRTMEMARKGEGGLRLRAGAAWRDFGWKTSRALDYERFAPGALARAQTTAYLRFYLRPSRIRNLFRLVGPREILRYARHTARMWLETLNRNAWGRGAPSYGIPTAHKKAKPHPPR